MIKKMVEKVLPWYKDDPWYCKVILTIEMGLIASAPLISIWLEKMYSIKPF